MSKLTLALSKGRILDETLPLLKAAGVTLKEDPEESRKLIFPNTEGNLEVLIIRASDVPTYVAYGAADLGVAGKDVIMEHGGEGYYEMLDLNIAKCRLMVAEPISKRSSQGRARVATKFTNIAKNYFAEKGEQVDMIKLYGSMELAPIVGLADKIVDVVDTGKTLKENGLEPTELIAQISSRLIVNKSSFKLKNDLLSDFLKSFEKVVG